MKLILTALAAAAILTGCETAPLSFIHDGSVYYHAQMFRYPVTVIAIDGDGAMTTRPLPVAPGEHMITFAAPPVAHFRDPVMKVYPMNIAACTRYYVAAQRVNSLSQDWDLVVEEVEPVGPCNPQDEMRKAQPGHASTSSSTVSGG